MSWSQEISQLRRDLSTTIDQRLLSLFGFTLSAKSSEMGDEDEVVTADGVDAQRPARRIEPWGHRGRSPGKVRTFWLRLGSSNVLFLGVAPSKGYGPDDLEDGETALYCAVGGTEIRLDQDGNVNIVSATGKLVTVNGDDFSLPKWDDFMSGLSTFLGNLKTDLTAANAGTLVGNPAIIAFETAIAAASQYKSTKAKNG